MVGLVGGPSLTTFGAIQEVEDGAPDVQPGDIVLVLYEKKVSKGEFKLA